MIAPEPQIETPFARAICQSKHLPRPAILNSQNKGTNMKKMIYFFSALLITGTATADMICNDLPQPERLAGLRHRDGRLESRRASNSTRVSLVESDNGSQVFSVRFYSGLTTALQGQAPRTEELALELTGSCPRVPERDGESVRCRVTNRSPERTGAVVNPLAYTELEDYYNTGITLVRSGDRIVLAMGTGAEVLCRPSPSNLPVDPAFPSDYVPPTRAESRL